MLQAVVTSNLLLIFPFPLSQSSQVTFLLNFFKALKKPAGCKEVGRNPHTLSSADVHTPLSLPFLLNVSLPLCFLAPSTVIFPCGLPCHLEHQVTGGRCPPPSCPLCCRVAPMEHWEWAGAAVGPWQVNRMRKSKLFLPWHSSLLPQGLCRLRQCIATRVHPLAVPQTVQWWWIPLDPVQCWILSKVSLLHWWTLTQYIIWSRRCTFRAVEGERMWICCNPKILKWFSGSALPALKQWV